MFRNFVRLVCCRCPDFLDRSIGDLLTSGCFTFVAVLTLQFSSDSAAQHSLYVKEHKVRAEKSSHRPMDRTLFVLNIPPYCSEVHFMSLGNLVYILCFVSFWTPTQIMKSIVKRINPVNSSHLYFRKLSKNCFYSLAPFCPWSWWITRVRYRSLDPNCLSSLNQSKNR